MVVLDILLAEFASLFMEPPWLLSYLAGSTRIEAVDKVLQGRDAVLQDARDRLLQAQQRMKNTNDSGHELTFVVGAWCLL